MPELNVQQEYLLPYIERYRALVKEVGDSITDYQAHVGEPYIITPQEHDFLTFQFYPSLQLNLEKFLLFERARDIQQTIYNARTVLSSLFGKEDYKKYQDSSLALQDVQKLMDANVAAGKILEPTKPINCSGKSEDKKQQKPKPSETERDTTLAKEGRSNIDVHISGNVKAKNLQIGHGASIYEQPLITAEKKKGIFKKIPQWIYYLVGFLAALLTTLHYLGCLEPIKKLIDEIFQTK